MSWTYSQSIAAYHALPPEQAAFWHTIYQLGTMFFDRYHGQVGTNITAKSPLSYFHMTMMTNDYFYSDPNSFKPYWVDGIEYWSLYPDSPVGNYSMVDTPIPDQWKVLQQLVDLGYGIEKRRIRKSYWTGAPRRRRNL